MKASFLSRFNIHLRGSIALGFLLVSLLATHWIGFSHGIAHSGIENHHIDLSCTDHEPALTHSSANCHLLDTLTLAGFLATETTTYFSINAETSVKLASIISPLARPHIGLYQSRAPPTFIL